MLARSFGLSDTPMPATIALASFFSSSKNASRSPLASVASTTRPVAISIARASRRSSLPTSVNVPVTRWVAPASLPTRSAVFGSAAAERLSFISWRSAASLVRSTTAML